MDNIQNYVTQPRGIHHIQSHSIPGGNQEDGIASRYASNIPPRPPGHQAKGSVVPPLNLSQPGAARETQERRSTVTSGRQGTAPNVVVSQRQTYTELITEGDQRKPPISIKQSDVIFMPTKLPKNQDKRDFSLCFYDGKMMQAESRVSNYHHLADCSEQSRRYASARNSSVQSQSDMLDQNLLFISKKEATLRKRIDIHENPNSKELIGTKLFQEQLKRNAKAVNISQDGNLVVILGQDFEVFVQDLRPLTNKMAYENAPFYLVDGFYQSYQEALKTSQEYLMSMIAGSRLNSARSHKDKEYEFKIHIDNDMTNIVVVSVDKNIVLTWSRKFGKKQRSKSTETQAENEEAKRIPGTTLGSARESMKSGLVRSNSATGIRQNVEQEKERSRSRLRSLFNIDLLKGQSSKLERPSSSKRGSLSKVSTEEQIRADSASRQRPPQAKKQQMQLEYLGGYWTNTTLHMANETAKYIKPICMVYSVSFPSSAQNKAFSTGLSTMEGTNGSPQTLNSLRNEGVLTQICMYDRA